MLHPSSSLSSRIPAPRPPEKAPPFRIPVLASLAPLLLAVALWLVTGSPFALLFAVLGPVTAVASWADSRLGARRLDRRETARFASEVAVTAGMIDERHAEERAAAAEESPDASVVAARVGADPWRWTADASAPVLVAIGTGTVRSGLSFDPPMADVEKIERTLRELRERAAVLDGAAVRVDARLGIGVAGPLILAGAVARSLALQLVWALSPASHWVAASAEASDWVEALPHPAGRRVGVGFLVELGALDQETALAGIAVAADPARLPGACRVVVALENGTARVLQHPDRAERRAIVPGVISRELARAWAERVRSDAEREGTVAAEARVPASIALAPLLRPEPGGPGSPLACEIAVDAAGPVTVDLVTHGPHAVIGGTTGSGKSELLVSWVLGMAARASPAVVTFLLVDFKGGAAFGPLAALPHTVGILTDLDEVTAARALTSLRAELRYRERSLAAAGARGIEDHSGLPRLVIVVDEFAAMLSDHPDLHALFADIAARGRSLGVHLLLCTQRPAGVVRDGVLANADLRISLRVNNRADSSAVIGSDAASRIPPQARGRALIGLAGDAPRPVQFALASERDIREVAARWADSPAPRRPWREPLPDLVDASRLSGVDGHPADPSGALVPPGVEPAEHEVRFGLLDLPGEQRWSVAVWAPQSDGHLLVLGGPRSGKSTALAALAAGADWIPGGVAAAWDALAALERSPGPRTIVIDDADSLLARFPPEYRDGVVERVARLLRDGPARGIHLILAAQRLTSDLQTLAGLAPARLLLRQPGKQDFLLAGGESAHYRPGLPPGGGVWHGERVQVAVLDPIPVSSNQPVVGMLDPRRSVAIVTTRSARSRDLFGAAGYEVRDLAEPGDLAQREADAPVAVIGEVEDWQSRWGALSALRPVADILFDGCSMTDYRSITRSRELPPPLTGLPGVMWRLTPEGGAERVGAPAS